METLGQRLKRLRQAKGLTQAQLATEAGFSSQGGIGNIERDLRGYGASIVKIADILGTTPDYLQTGIDKHLYISSNIEPGPNIKGKGRYPIVSLVQAGKWTGSCEGVEAWQAEEYGYSPYDLGECGYLLRVRGSSMTSKSGPHSFPDGMLLHVNPHLEAKPGQFVIARREAEHEATFKLYTLVDGEPYLEAINPDWPHRFLKMLEGDAIVGVVVDASFGRLP
ncbi:LexA family protein [Comamonas testosteroni]|uniref:LexA repressor n=1 Tax=Comamonas testosteroni TaxID=285 RepID=A0A8B4S935_COMTE|nr:S24 family peptidase [Comamonas testosteroni]EHN64265.1 putative prophage repressor [Comamonas testosteroni ATCC 11996]QQN67785.1 helix-turn-helix domain-containing protein [Comamonas testosteroni]SUY79028.1 LexA repressor [Comamonas testosteroni]